MNRLKGHSVYLVSPIDDCPEGGKTWREYFGNFLKSLEIGVFDPTKKPLDIIDETLDNVAYIKNLKKAGDYTRVRNIMRKIVAADLHCCDLANFIVAFLDLNLAMCGTISEITFASLQKKPVIIICPQGKAAVPSWLFGLGLKHEMFFETFDDAENYIKHIAFDEKIDDLGRWRFIDYNKVFNENK